MGRKAAGSGVGQGGGEIPAAAFRSRLMEWYRGAARELPWRKTTDPYRIWVSEIMLQQTRVEAVIEHYTRFVARFPTVVALSLAREDEVLAAWSGLGYYRRARMLHKAAQFLVLERAGVLPGTAMELRTLPGIGEYTAAAIASIAFGERVAVVDGNVERVVLRLTGRGEEAESPLRGAAMRTFIREQAQALMPVVIEVGESAAGAAGKRRAAGWDAAERIAIAAAAHPELPADEAAFGAAFALEEAGADAEAESAAVTRPNAAGDHNQAVMELGATICLPRGPLCLSCPVQALCRTRGEHRTAERPKQLSRPVAFLLETRKRGTATEVLLERRPDTVSLMAGMYELPGLPMELVEGREPVLRVRHAITNTNYYVQVYAAGGGARQRTGRLRSVVLADGRELEWVKTGKLGRLPLTGLARKVLHRMKVMDGPEIELLK